MAQRLMADGIPVIEYRAVTSNFSEPTKELEAAMRSKRLWHDGNPVLDGVLATWLGIMTPAATSIRASSGLSRR
jgi:phage terminase large subunit-like protein